MHSTMSRQGKQTINTMNINEKVINIVSDYYNKIPSVVMIYLALWIGHFISANMYPNMCCNMSFFGFLMSPFMTVAPHCQALRWFIDYSANQLKNYWIFLGTYLVSYITKRYFLTKASNE